MKNMFKSKQNKFNLVPAMNVEKVLKDVVEKHNNLARNVDSHTEQLVGTIDQLQKSLTQSQFEIKELQSYNKTLAFHINKIQCEFLAMRIYLEEQRGIDFKNFKETANRVLKVDLGINSDYIPVGKCSITYYN